MTTFRASKKIVAYLLADEELSKMLMENRRLSEDELVLLVKNITEIFLDKFYLPSVSNDFDDIRKKLEDIEEKLYNNL